MNGKKNAWIPVLAPPLSIVIDQDSPDLVLNDFMAVGFNFHLPAPGSARTLPKFEDGSTIWKAPRDGNWQERSPGKLILPTDCRAASHYCFSVEAKQAPCVVCARFEFSKGSYEYSSANFLS